MTQHADKKGVWGWMFFDWASQPYNTMLITFVFGPYFVSSVVGDPVQGQATWGYMIAAVGIFLAILSPILGSIADSSGPRKPWIWFFSALYVGGAYLLWWAVPGMPSYMWILVAFGVGMIGMEFATVFTNAMLPDLGPREDLGRISGSGWAFGYWGGLVTLVVMLVFLAENEEGKTLIGNSPLFGLDAAAREGTRSVGPFTAIWYLVFMIPFFLWVPDVKKKKLEKGMITKSLTDLAKTLKSLPNHPSLMAYLGSSMFYRDALNGLYTFGGIYAVGVLEWSLTDVGVFGILAIFTGAIFAWLGGKADKKFGPKPIIIWCAFTLIIVCTMIVLTSRESVLLIPVAEGSSMPDIMFYICGAIIGAAGGSIQAASRTMFVRQANPERMTEAFGLYALSGKATAFLAPFLIAVTTDITNSQRLGITPIVGLFVIGLVMLIWVKPKGEHEE